MKKIILTILVAVTSASVYAQLGVTAGLNMAKYSYNNGSSRKALTSFNAGLLYRTDLGKDFKWQPELAFSQKGARSFPANSPVGVVKYTNKLNYIELSSPFIYNTNFGGAADYTFDFGVGPYVAYLVGGKNIGEKADGSKTKRDFDIGNDTGNQFKPIDAGLTFITGVIIKKQYGVHLKYDSGLRNLEPTYSAKLKTGNFAINFTYFFK